MQSRPTMSQEIRNAATRAVADRLVEATPGKGWWGGRDRDGIVAELASAIDELRPRLREGERGPAEALGERFGFIPTRMTEKVLSDLLGEEMSILGEAVRRWVADAGVTAPFTEAARATLSPQGARLVNLPPGTGGVVLRRPDLDASAYARFVPDRDRETFVDSKALRGHRIVRWEDLATVDTIREDLDHAVADAARRRLAASPGTNPPRPRDPLPGSRLAQALPHQRPGVIRALMDEARTAMDGTDEDVARAALDALRKALVSIRAVEDYAGPGRFSAEPEEPTAPAP